MSGRVAVIAVHGVADQLPFATARATADLLKCHLADKVSGFHEEQLRLEVLPLRTVSKTTQPPAPEAQPQNLETKEPVPKKPADSTSSSREVALATRLESGVKLACDSREASLEYFETKQNSDGRPQPDDAKISPDEVDRQIILGVSREASLEYFGEQLSGYRQRPADAMYETVCLSATIGDKQVDVHEMYWADLSRVQSGIFQAFEELYYVLFAVCNIGRMELDRSKRLFKGWRWWGLRQCEGIAERILTLFVPLGNACLMLLLVFALPHLLDQRIKVDQWWVLLLLGIGVGLLVGTIAFVLISRRQPKQALCYLLSGAGVCGLLGFCISRLHTTCIHVVLSVLLWVACGLVLLGVGWAYNRRQPGALFVSGLLGILILGAVLVEVKPRATLDKYWALDIGLAVAEWTLLGLFWIWLAYLVMAVVCWGLGCLVVRKERKSSPRRKTAARLVWTANLAILAPGMLFIILNLGIWEAAYLAAGSRAEPLFPKDHQHTPIDPIAGPLQKLAEIDAREWPRKEIDHHSSVDSNSNSPFPTTDRVPGLLLHMSALPMIVVLVALVSMLLSAGWLLLPAILSEGTTASDPKHEYARQLGNSLSSAWYWMRWWARPFVQLQVVMLIAVCCLLYFLPLPLPLDSDSDLRTWLYRLSAPVLVTMGMLFVAFATGAPQYAGLRTVVDVAADVANWLRLHPRDDNPTSRISARYVSLLRYVAQRKNEKGGPYYDRVVIFAHSLGSAITVDLLQFLEDHLQKHPDLDEGLARLKHDNADKLPVYLFTHGCPLRQLLGLRLPFTYGWAWHGSKGWDHNEEPVGQELLGIVTWVNAYCSGDYVGRYLWHDDVADTPWDSQRREKPGTVPRVELCVGAGAHVHYWDPDPQAAGAGATASSAPSTKIAEELLNLIGCELPAAG